jgi:predicted tellurium resistance membrane protein TerC
MAWPKVAERYRTPPLSFGAAIGRIVVADVSMSLDNVLAVAGAAKGSPAVLIIGLGVAIVLMRWRPISSPTSWRAIPGLPGSAS